MVAWLLGEPAGRDVRSIFATEDHVFTSDLTVVEVHRTILRGILEGRLDERRAGDARRRLSGTSRYWTLLRLDREVLDRAGRPFPCEPLRTLDALHLASALLAASFVERLALLSLDARIRRAAGELGLEVLPGS